MQECRIDHVMGLHRLFWIPRGLRPSEAVYVHYPADEFYAILSLESHRHHVQIVGENLGTVPPYVHQALAKHRIHGMHVSQFCVTADPQRALQEAAHDDVASLNTHDTPTFAGFWQGKDIEDRLALGLLSPAEAQLRSWTAHPSVKRSSLSKIARLASRRISGPCGDSARLALSIGERGCLSAAVESGRSLAGAASTKCPRHLGGAAQLETQSAVFVS